MSEELKACPFCGRDAIRDLNPNMIFCPDGFNGDEREDKHCWNDAILTEEDWQHRPIEDALRKQLEIAVEALKDIRGKAYPNGVPLSIKANDALAEIEKISKPTLDTNTDELIKVYYPVDKSILVFHGFKWGGTHVGVDWIVPVGTPIPSIKDGEVIESAQDSKTYGGYVLIKHDDGYGSLYAHLSKLKVKRGDNVKGGDIIGLSGGVPGTPGAGASQGYHLHFEIRPPGELDNNWHNVDPIEYLNKIGDVP
jgi:murein DD-endopeptidase MepM/ murein hydrolase activator NlpD